MTSLEERLKLLRQHDCRKAENASVESRTDNRTTGPVSSHDIARDDEIEQMLQSARDEVAVEFSHANRELHGYSGDFENESDKGSDASSNVADKVSGNIDETTLTEINDATQTCEEEAQRALKDLYQDPQVANLLKRSEKRSEGSELRPSSSSKLILEPKPKPQLSRGDSSKSGCQDGQEGQWQDQDEGSKSLEDALADAMAQSRDGQSSFHHAGWKAHVDDQKRDVKDETVSRAEPSSREEVGELDTLSMRLRQLRGGGSPPHHTSEEEECDSKPPSMTTFFGDLPTAPTTMPSAQSKDSDGDWRARHGVKDRDLEPFEALIKLNAKELGEPSTSNRPLNPFPDIPTIAPGSKTEAGHDETEYWCCICNEDAVVACSGCDDDLYCKTCWVEGHTDMEQEERAEHRPKHFNKPSKVQKQQRALAA